MAQYFVFHMTMRGSLQGSCSKMAFLPFINLSVGSSEYQVK